MSDVDELKKAVEKLSEQEFQRLKLLKKVSDIVNSTDVSEINRLPSLYKIEIKKALEEVGDQTTASQIET